MINPVEGARTLIWYQPAKSVVIAQIYGGGGNSGALWRHDFIELYNAGGTTVDLSGWSLHYASATGTTWQRTVLSGTLAPGRRYLVQQASGGVAGSPLPAPDLTGTIPLAATAGKVVLMRTNATIAAGTSCPGGSDLVDLVGYGPSADCYEGTAPTVSPSSTTSVNRVDRGCGDTNQNRADFTLAPPAPLNGASPPYVCGQPTNPSGVAVASPNPAQAGDFLRLEVAITPGTSPPSSSISVVVDLRTVGGVSALPLLDDGQGADQEPGDGRYTTRHLLPLNLPARRYPLEIAVRDGEGRQGLLSIGVDVVAPGPPSPVVISQIYASGGNSGALYSHDWVEVFNRSRTNVNLSGWSLQYATATGSTWSRAELNGDLPAGRYHLIRLASGGSGPVPPTADSIANINLSSSGGKILLTKSAGNIQSSCPVGEARADLIGYGSTAGCYEGAGPAPAPGASTALIRWGNGCRETDQNSSDWRVDRPRPRNTSSPPADCDSYLYQPGTFAGGQVPGSVLIYPAYSSISARPHSEDTRLTLTNSSPNQHVAVRLFWVNGGAAATADNLVSLTPNQTLSLLASDVDPDIAGYLLAVAVDLQTGRPVNFNHLIGSQYLKLESGQSGNFMALSVRAIEPEPSRVDPAAASGELVFDDNYYQRLPSRLALSYLPAPAEGAESILIVDRVEGSLVTGMRTVGDIQGVVYSDLESAHSFVSSSTRRQWRLQVNDRSPRVTPRLSVIIPATRAGWMRIAPIDGGAIVAILLSRNGQGRTLHSLDRATEAVVEFPLPAG